MHQIGARPVFALSSFYRRLMAALSPRDRTDTLTLYTKDVARYPLLTQAQEQEIGARALAGDLDAQNQLMEHNLRFVIMTAKPYQREGVQLMDLIQAGNIGLRYAARKFDPTRGVRFISYAVSWIRQAIQKELDTSTGDIRPTQTQQVRIRRVRRMQAEAVQQQGRELSVAEVAVRTNYTAARIQEAQDSRIRVTSFDAPAGHDETGLTLAQTLGAEDGREEAEAEAELRTVVHQVMARVLSERERTVLAEYFGFRTGEERRLTEIGQEQGISRERVRQLKERALRKLRAATELHPELLDVFTPGPPSPVPATVAVAGERDEAESASPTPGSQEPDRATVAVARTRAPSTRRPARARVGRRTPAPVLVEA